MCTSTTTALPREPSTLAERTTDNIDHLRIRVVPDDDPSVVCAERGRNDRRRVFAR
jgi:hypothetical protein